MTVSLFLVCKTAQLIVSTIDAMASIPLPSICTSSSVCEVCDDSHPATPFCFDCRKYMCSIAVQYHVKFCPTHRLIGVSHPFVSPTEKCPEHGKRYKLYDTQCARVVCTHCIILNHKGHDCKTPSSAAKEFREKLASQLVEANRLIEKVKDAEARIENVLSELPACQQETEDKVKKTFAQVCLSIFSNVAICHRLYLVHGRFG